MALSFIPDYKDAKAPMHALLPTRSGAAGAEQEAAEASVDVRCAFH